ncbi:MAG: GH92 family glycosyl hydrolase [Rikenellaceae bacterium]
MKKLFYIFWHLQIVLFGAVALSSCSGGAVANCDEDFDAVSYVYPFLDSENSRWFFFSSASRPFGMVNLSPDTGIGGAWGSGYRYNCDTVKGFSHVHAWQLSALSVMPVTFDKGQSSRTDICSDFYSHFSHDTEVASPGYHKLHLDRYAIDVELTSTKRVGFHKYKFMGEGERGVVLNLNTPLGPSPNTDGVVTRSDKNTISGEVTSQKTIRRPRPVRVYFEIAFDHDVASVEMDPKTKNYVVSFEGDPQEVLMKASISYTSAANARTNMEGELAEWNFEDVVEDSHAEWNSMLSRIKITTPDQTAMRRFYTDLWHALQGRRVISDINGAYPDNTSETFRIGQIPTDAEGKPLFNQYNSDSFWGAQWTLTTLWQLVYPEIAEEFVNSMLTYYKDGGMIPRGPSGGNYTYVMTGASSTPFIVGAYQKGIRGYDVELAYEGLRKNHMLDGGIMERAGYEHNARVGGGLKYYINNGYIPYPNPDVADKGLPMHVNGPAQTLEYAYQDWTLAQMALALGKKDDYELFMKRSQNYQNVYDAQSGWARPKDVNGVWLGGDSFDPYEYIVGFTESNAAQMTWFVPHDLGGLAELMGGKEKAAEKLNQQFEEAAKLQFTSGTSIDYERDPSLRRIPINYGNQPSIQTAFVFNYLDQPQLTQYWSRQVADKVFSTFSTDRGYCGDEDQGLMGALSVLYKIGLFQMDGGTSVDPYYELGSPMYDRVEITLNPDYYSGKKFVIEAANTSMESCYIKSAKLNGQKVDGYRISHKDIVAGGALSVEMTSEAGL